LAAFTLYTVSFPVAFIIRRFARLLSNKFTLPRVGAESRKRVMEWNAGSSDSWSHDEIHYIRCVKYIQDHEPWETDSTVKQ